jgi:hypothetical protein
MTDEELIARLRLLNEVDANVAADRIEALVERLTAAEQDAHEAEALANEALARAERLEARLAAAVGVLEFYARSERDDAGLLAETVLAKIKGDDHD